MKQLFRRLLLPARLYEGSDAARDAKVLYVTLLSVFAFVILNIVGVAFIYVRKLGVSIILLMLIAIEVLCLRLLFRGRIRLANSVLVFGLWSIATIHLALTGGITSPSKYHYVVICVFAGLLLGRRALAICVCLTIAAGLGMVLAESLGHPLPEYYVTRPSTALIIFAFTLLLVLVPLNLLLDQLKEAIAFARSQLKERENADIALRESEDRYRDLVEHSDSLICTTDLDGRILSANTASAKILEYKTSELLSMNIRDILAPEVRDKFDDYCTTLQTNRTAKGIMSVMTKSGERRIWEYHNTLRTKGVPAPIVRGMARDVTERKRAEKALRSAQRHLRDALAVQRRITESLPTISFITTDLQGTVMSFSAGAENIFGYRGEEMIGQPVGKLHVAEDVAKFPSIIRAQREGRVGYNGEITLVRKNGERFPASFITSPILDDEGHVLALLGVSQDITERKRLEEQLLQAQKMEAVGRLAGGIAHEFNNLLCAVIGFSELVLKRGDLAPTTRKRIETILEAGNTAAAVTAQLLAFSRRKVSQPVAMSLNTALSRVENILRNLIGEDLELRLLPGPLLWPVKADPVQIEQVLLNLTINARDAMPKGGRLTIETTNCLLDEISAMDFGPLKPGPYALLTVTDTGIGMDKETQSHIFEPFFTTKEPGKGTGLGLSTAFGIIQESGGHIWLTTKVDQGTTFKIFLPRAESEPAGEEPDKVTASFPQGSETILVVEDSMPVREFIGSCLQESGYMVLEARDPSDALRIVLDHKGSIALLITDLVMPTMSGRELADQLKRLKPEISVLYISGYSEQVIDHLGLGESPAAFLQKPLTVNLLISKVRAALGGCASLELSA